MLRILKLTNEKVPLKTFIMNGAALSSLRNQSRAVLGIPAATWDTRAVTTNPGDRFAPSPGCQAGDSGAPGLSWSEIWRKSKCSAPPPSLFYPSGDNTKEI